jgi:catechol-2,3-dioxygenase
MDLRWDAVVIDCRDPEALAGFWCALLDVEVRGRWAEYVGLHPMAPGQPRLVLQRTDDPRPAKNTVHLDLHVEGRAALEAATARAVSLGATVDSVHDEDVASWRTLADPEGNLFCLVAD